MGSQVPVPSPNIICSDNIIRYPIKEIRIDESLAERQEVHVARIVTAAGVGDVYPFFEQTIAVDGNRLREDCPAGIAGFGDGSADRATTRRERGARAGFGS